ncbi:hypothetical protein AB0M22_21490 [Nocardia sp. NPDC051756]|uniref:hypothetical protein n=1 Tax=Nocardia sp. NPDC051756 TaxID=3154751 RepID=UPI00341D06C8
MASALLVGLAVFLGGIALVATLFGFAWTVLNLLERRSKKVTVSDIQRRLSHEKPICPLSVKQAMAEEPEHRECSVARCHKKRAINRTLAAQRRREADARSNSSDQTPLTEVSPIERWP